MKKQSPSETTSFVTAIIQKLHDNKAITIAIMETITIMRSKKFIIFLAIFLLPVLTVYFPPISNAESLNVDNFVMKFETIAGNLILSYWASLPTQLVAVFIASEYIAGEYDRQTLKLLFTKPLRKVDIILGKMLSFIVVSLVLILPSYLLFVSYFVLYYNCKYDVFATIISSSFWYGTGIIFLTLFFVASFAVAVSSIMKRPLYAALTAIISLIGIQLFANMIPLIEEPEKYTITYQVGIMLEELYYLSDLNLYEGDPIFTFSFFVVMSLIFLMIAELSLIKKEVP